MTEINTYKLKTSNNSAKMLLYEKKEKPYTRELKVSCYLCGDIQSIEKVQPTTVNLVELGSLLQSIALKNKSFSSKAINYPGTKKNKKTSTKKSLLIEKLDNFKKQHHRLPRKYFIPIGFDTEFSKCLDSFKTSFEDLELLQNTEFITNKFKDDDVISYQFSHYLGDNLFLNFVFEPYKQRLTLKELYELLYNYFIELLIVDFKPNTLDEIHFMTIAHCNFVDILKIKDWSRTDNTYTIRNCICTKEPINLKIYDINRNISNDSIYIHYNDTMLLNEPKSLKKLGDDVGLEKLDIEDSWKSNMLTYYLEYREEFLEYAMRDAEICAFYLYLFWKDKLDKIPPTIASYTSNMAKKELKNFYGWTEKDFKKHINSVQVLDIEDFDKSKGYRVKRQIEYSATSEINTFEKMYYYGGRNETFYHGMTDGYTTDIDFASFYPLCMSLIRFIDYATPPYFYKDVYVNDSTFDYNSIECGILTIDFDYTCVDDKVLRVIPIYTANGLIYVNKGEDIKAHIEEVKQAYRDGAKIFIKSGSRYKYLEEIPIGKNFKEWNTEIPPPLRDKPFGTFLYNGVQKRKKFPKTDPQNKLYKLMGNSLTGKTGQGHKNKKVRNIHTNSMENITACEVSSPAYIPNTTAIGRSLITAAMNSIIKFFKEKYSQDVHVLSVTTDGFQLNNKGFKVTEKHLKEFENYMYNSKECSLFKNYKDMATLFGINNTLEIKHEGTETLILRTRNYIVLNVENEDLTQISTAGYKKNFDENKMSKNELARHLIEKLGNSKGLVYFKHVSLATPAKVLKGKADTSKEEIRSYNPNYDFKREIVGSEKNSLGVLWLTKTWKSLEDFIYNKANVENYRDIRLNSKENFAIVEYIPKIKKIGFKFNKKAKTSEIVEKLLFTILKNAALVRAEDNKLYIYNNNFNKGTSNFFKGNKAILHEKNVKLDYDTMTELLQSVGITPSKSKRDFQKIKKRDSQSDLILENKEMLEDFLNSYFSNRVIK